MHDFSLNYSKKKSFFLLFHFTLGYFLVYPMILFVILSVFGIDSWLYDGKADTIYSIIMLVVSIYFTKGLLLRSINELADNPGKVFKTIVTTLPMMLLGSIVLNYLITTFTGQAEAQNQTEIIGLFEQAPYLIIIQALLYAPIVEEIMFRGLVFGGLSKRSMVFAVIVSSSLFGLAHVYNSILSGNFADLWFFPTYALLGYFLNRAYIKSGSIVSSMALHFLNNAIGLLAISAIGLF
ncbi:MAG: CPBP family intramembrane metalloprotease [Erysipelotrichaceae bacterium]|nr:CPBP family intramembrane metalloprotease [Erysipelotrichaceae bacterium]